MKLTDTPLISSEMGIQPDWIDYNGHLNMAFYSVLFDRSVDEVYELLGMGPQYANTRKLTTYTGEFHICYLRELHLDHKVRSRFQLIDFDDKRLHTYQELVHSDGWVAATAESLTLHIDMSGPRVPFPEDVHARIKALHAAHSALPTPERVGRSIGIRRRKS